MKKVLLTSALLFASTHAMAAGPQAGRLSIWLMGGGDVPVDGDVHTGAVVDVPDLGPLNPALAGVDAQLRIGSRNHERVYGMASTYGVGMGWGVSDRLEVFGELRETHASAGSVQVGEAYVPALDVALPVYGRFSSYQAWSAEVGVRWFFMDPGYARPYVAARLGGTETDDIDATFEIPAADILIPDAPFYEKKWALSAGLDVGVNIPLSERASFIAETGVRYVDDLEGDDSAIGPLGLSRINDTGRRISVPVTLALRWDF